MYSQVLFILQLQHITECVIREKKNNCPEQKYHQLYDVSCWSDGIRVRRFDTRPIFQPPRWYMSENGAAMDRNWQEKTVGLGEKPVRVPPWPLKI
jgi:hypothetical protein